MADFIKLKPGQSLKARLKTPSPNEYQGKWGKQLMYTFTVNNTDHTLALSESSPANEQIRMLRAGDDVVIRKVDIGGGKSTWNVVLEGDISTLPQNQNIPSGPEAFQAYVESPANEYGEPTGNYDLKEAQRQASIELQSALRSSCIFLASRTDAKSDDVLEMAVKFYEWNQAKLNRR